MKIRGSFFGRLLVASSDGYVYVYSISSVEGGECQLVKKHDLRNIENTPPPKPFGKAKVCRKVKRFFDSGRFLSCAVTEGVPMVVPPATLPPGPSYASALKGNLNDVAKTVPPAEQQ